MEHIKTYVPQLQVLALLEIKILSNMSNNTKAYKVLYFLENVILLLKGLKNLYNFQPRKNFNFDQNN